MADVRARAALCDPGAAFWEDFVRRYWGRRPTVIRQPFARAIASPAEVFAAMVAGTRRLKADDLDYAFTIDGVRVGANVEPWLPTAKDGSLDGLAARIARALPGSSFSVFVRAFQLELGWEFWRRLRSFLTGLYGLAGVPADCAEVDLFAGNYAESRRGIHLDSADVFCFVIEGRKRIRLWPPSTFKAGGTYWYGIGGSQRHLSRSTCLDGEPGDILYWPSSYWHVGESLGGTVCSLSVGLYMQDSLAATAARAIEADAARRLGLDNFIHTLPVSAARLEPLPPRARQAVANASKHLSTMLLRRRMEQISGYAFTHIPAPPPPARVRASSVVSADPVFPIVYRSVGRTVIIAANGRSIAVPRSKALRAAIDALRRGSPVRLPLQKRGVQGDVHEVIRFLLLNGAAGVSPAP